MTASRRSRAAAGSNRRALANLGLARDRLRPGVPVTLANPGFVALSVLSGAELTAELSRMARAADPVAADHWRKATVIANTLVDALAVDVGGRSTVPTCHP